MIWWVICENRLTIGFRNAFLWEILQEIFKICKSSGGNAVVNSVGNAAGNAAGNLVGKNWGNDAVFSLNMWLRTIYCLQSIHKPACVILTVFQFVFKVFILTHYCSKFPSQPIIVQSLHFGQLLLAHLESAYSLIWGSHEIWGKGGG